MFNITVNQVSLLAAIKRVAPVVPSRFTVPIVTSFKLSANGSELTIIGTDLDNSVETTVSAQVAGEGVVCVNAKEFKAAITALNSKDKSARVIINQIDSESLSVSCNGVTQRFNVVGTSEDYPTLPVCESPVVNLTALQLATICGMSYATDQRKYNVGQLLTCVNVQINGKLDVCATDGSRLVHFADALPVGSQATVNTNLPNVGVDLLSKALDKKCNDVKVYSRFQASVRAEYLAFETDNTRVTVRTNQGEYPRYAELFPSSQPTAVIKYDRLALLAAVKTGAKLNKTQLIKLDGSSIKATSEEQSFNAFVSCDASDNVPQLGVNGVYLAEWLESITDKQVTIELTGSLKPVEKTDNKGAKYTQVPATLKPLIMRDSTRDMRYLLMPVQCK